MKVLTAFVLVGTIDSHDGQFATVELDLNPATNGGPAIAVMPSVKTEELTDIVVVRRGCGDSRHARVLPVCWLKLAAQKLKAARVPRTW